MAEDATTFDPSIASEGTPIPDQPEVSATSETDRIKELHNASTLDTTPLLFVLDHNGNKYPIPWDQSRGFSRFKSYVEEIYVRKGDEKRLDEVRNDKFNVAVGAADEARVILPSLWNDFMREGMTVRISFWFDEQELSRAREHSLFKDREVVFVDADIDVEHVSRDASASGSKSPDEENSIHDDDDDAEESDSASEDDGKAPEISPAEQVRVIIKPVDEGGNPLSFAIDTRWATKYLSISMENNGSKGSLAKNTLRGRDMATETLKITKAITTTADNRTTLEIHTLPGPENSAFVSSIGIRWFHLHADALDWNQFKNTCMSLPDLSERDKYLIAKTLHKVEKEYIKAFLGGVFIEPGTVVRGDECNQPDPQSVIFSCTPYFNIQRSLPSNIQTDRLHPARSLIQSYYPYEPVMDRDQDQAYRKFGNARAGDLIHVPSLWMLNICGRAVVTCGYGPLSSDFTKSIEVLQEDLKQLGSRDNSITSIRLTDEDGRVLLFSPLECETYFQAEQRIRELRGFASRRWYANGPKFILRRQAEIAKATPANWPVIIRERSAIFIDLSVVDQVPEEAQDTSSSLNSITTPIQGTVPPFFHWPSSLSDDEMGLDSVPSDVRHAIRCLGQVEKAMLNDILPEMDTGGPVDRTFTSTNYYESLPEEVFEDVQMLLLSQIRTADSMTDQSHHNHHQRIVHAQASLLPVRAQEFTRIVHDTLGLFIGEVDNRALLRKVWGSMAQIARVVQSLSKQPTCDPDPKEYNDPKWKAPKTGTRSWRIRTPNTSYTYANQHATKLNIPLPDNDRGFGATVKKCRRCVHEVPFNDPNAALKHLRNHAAAEASKQGAPASSSFVKDDEAWKDWIRNDDQALLESTLTGACKVLDLAIQEASTIYEQLHELIDGVRNDQGDLSELYFFPGKLLETLHRLLVFYFAVERSIYYTKENFDQTKKGGYQEDYPYTDLGLDVLKRFDESVKSSLLQARVELCEMVRSSPPIDFAERMSWGPESISSWLMRRLIVKPLEKSMTVGDMYREYLTTLQFQVNHRPGKRLLRSINLLQEELTILAQVNDWQTKLIKNYMCVLDDATYPADIPSRHALYPYDRLLLNSCLENLALTREEYEDQIRRCGPLSDSTKQSAEINEEDHGKAILVFTVVTVIFLPLSFVTSYLGMNTSDIRDMDSKQSLFWEISLPLTVGVMAIMLAIAYNGDEFSDFFSSVYRSLTGKQDRSLSARGISVLQRSRAAKSLVDSSTTLSLADDAEYAAPRAKPDYYNDNWYSNTWDRFKKNKPGGFPDKDVLYTEESGILPQPRYARPATHTPAFPLSRLRQSPKPDAVPYSYTEPITYTEPVSTKAAPPPPPTDDVAYPRAKLYNTSTPGVVPPPPPASSRPTYIKIHRDYILTSVLDDANLPWEYYPFDPNYIVIKRWLEEWETEELFARSKRIRGQRVPLRFDALGQVGTIDPEMRMQGGYVWESKKDKRRRARRRR